MPSPQPLTRQPLTQPTPQRSPGSVAPLSPRPSDNLSPQRLVLGWFRAYPGVWLSPLALGALAGWVLAQPDTTPPGGVAPAAIAPTQASSLPFVHLEPQPLGPVLPFGPALPPSLVNRAASAATNNAATNNTANKPATSALLLDESVAPTESANPDAKAADAKAADAKAAIAERAQAQAQAFARAKAAAEAAAVPPQPDPAPLGNPAVDQLITMQVAIAEGDTTLAMGSSDGGVVMTLAGQPLVQLQAGQYGMQCNGTGLVLNGEVLPETVMLAPVAGGLNTVRDRSYRGRVQFICQGNTVLAVNHIDLQNYLYSVVGSEVSASWPAAALKAQAVAARSYALTYFFRPAKPHFHIGDTESYQVYKGTVSEDSRIKAAVQATAGEFISAQGGIVESLYAASDDIVMEAFQGGGMSQLGALEFATQGYNYLQILGYYYPNTSLGRLMIEG